ncbi:MAG: T9SS type A sorting domain-containing protein [Syntrophothermus sp.]
MLRSNKIKFLAAAFSLVFLSGSLNSQIREYRIHNRGMLHETVYNTGEIGRAWMTGAAGNKTGVPLMEWPSRSETVVNGIPYSGQHNLLGAGVYIAANVDGKPGTDKRLYSYNGGVGATDPEVSFGRWSFPLSMEEIQNYPVLADGTLNPAYNPDEAEQIIKASWASNTGITTTRTSRQWSYPDYDDMIIYEYEFEYTGDTDGNPATIERDSTLKDVMFCFIYGFAPSMYGYQRHYQEWKYEAGIYRGDQRNYWDSDLWLGYNMDVQTNLVTDLAGKPEPDINLFRQNASTGLNGGGLCSPQAPGFAMLYYDANHLAVVDPIDKTRNESEAVSVLKSSGGVYYELDEKGHIKQPWSNKVSTGNTNSVKMGQQAINPNARWSGVYSKGSTTWPTVKDTAWWGRAAYNYRQANDAGQKHIVFGPYTLKKGDKLRFALAEVIGYGAEAGKMVEGGQVSTQWAANPTWNKKITINGTVVAQKYLDEYGYPDYVNSNVRNVTQVATKAFEAYLGKTPSIPVWPESNPSKGSYKIPVPCPAPAIELTNTPGGEINIKWNRNAESFTHPRLMGQLAKYKVYRADFGMGPWKLLTTIDKGNVGQDNSYTFVDSASSFKIGESRYYAVTAVDDKGNESGKTNISKFQKNIGSVETMDKVYVVPNPFVANSGFQGSGNVADKIGFYGLPAKCTIRIFSYSGQLVQVIEHDKALYSDEWFQVTQNGQEIASGIYFFVVTTPDGQKSSGKFIVVK